MTKADIARIVYERHGGISNREAARLVEIIFDSIKSRLGGGEKVQITGFGTFVIRQKRERRGRNPQTGEEMVIKPRRSVVFRPSKLFGAARGIGSQADGADGPARSRTSSSSRSVRSARSPTRSRTSCATGSRSSRRWPRPRTAPASASTAGATSRPSCASSSSSTRRASRSPAPRSAWRSRWRGAWTRRMPHAAAEPGRRARSRADDERRERAPRMREVREQLREILTLLERNDRNRV